MRLILSRKGFDSAAGGCPSPIFPDGRILSLPIPDKQSPTRYEDIKWNEYDLGKIVSDVTDGWVRPSYYAHLDPDLDSACLPRPNNWRPAFGQGGAAQGHLRNQGVGKGDLFLFFGLFRELDIKANKLVWRRTAPRRHIIWGWLEIAELIAVDLCNKNEYAWLHRHPHFHCKPDPLNTLYIGNTDLEFLNARGEFPGTGIFRTFSKQLQLTADNATGPGRWKLPPWFYPEGSRPPLSYHADLGRWQRTQECTLLKAADRGQEFVLDCAYYPEATEWVRNLLNTSETLTSDSQLLSA